MEMSHLTEAPQLESLPAPSMEESEDNLTLQVPTGEAESLRIHPYGVGVDCHSKFYQVTLLVRQSSEGGNDGAVRYEWTVPATVPALVDARDRIIETLAEHDVELPEPHVDHLRYTAESSGPYHKPLMNAWGGKPSIVNPLLAGSTRRKTDVLDARLLAYQSMTGVWPATYVMPHHYEQCRHWVRAVQHWRQAERQARQKIINLTTMYGHTIAATGPVQRSENRALIEDLAVGRVMAHPNIHPEGVPPAVGRLILDWYDIMDDAARRSQQTWKTAKALIDEQAYLVPKTGEILTGRELATLIQTIPGVGEKTAYVLIVETGDISRFPAAKAYAAFCGFDPSLKVSAGKVTSQTRRRGNVHIHDAVVMATTALITRRSEPFGQWAYVLSKKSKKGGFRKAQGAVGRRIVTAVYHCWSRGDAFSYEGYQLDSYSHIATVAVEGSVLPSRVQRLLIEAGYRDSAHVARKLADVFGLGGIGDRAREDIEAWLSSCREQSSVGSGESPVT